LNQLRLGLLLVLCTPPAFAADWLLIWSGPDEVLMIDRSSVRREADRAQAWTMKTFDRRIDNEGISHQSSRSHMVADCRAGRLGFDERIFLAGTNATGAVVRAEKPERVQMAEPATAAEKMVFAMLCAG
jgi:hypothetical protein